MTHCKINLEFFVEKPGLSLISLRTRHEATKRPCDFGFTRTENVRKDPVQAENGCPKPYH